MFIITLSVGKKFLTYFAIFILDIKYINRWLIKFRIFEEINLNNAIHDLNFRTKMCTKFNFGIILRRIKYVDSEYIGIYIILYRNKFYSLII